MLQSRGIIVLNRDIIGLQASILNSLEIETFLGFIVKFGKFTTTESIFQW